MAISTFSELSTALANWLHRSDLTDRIPEFIALAEAKISKDVRCRAMVKRVQASISSRYADAPSDALDYINIQITVSGSIRRLKYMTAEQIDYAFDSASSGVPEIYSMIGDELQFSPSPDQSYTAEIAYYGRFAALSDGVTANWLLTNHPSIYLYGALLAAEPFLVNDQRALTWAELYQREVDGLNEQENKAATSGASLQMRADVVA